MKQNSSFSLLFLALAVLILLLSGGIFLLRSSRLAAEAADNNPLPTTAPTVASLAEVVTFAATAAVVVRETPAGTPEVVSTEILPTDTPPPTLTPSPTETPQTYIVRDGDVLSNIAIEFGVSMEVLASLNNISNPALIQPGQVLLIPSANSQPVSTAPPGATPATPVVLTPDTVVVGTSAGGRAFWDWIFGGGPVHLVFVGGIHGGYEWNTVALAYEMISYFQQNPDAVPENITLHIIPNANPDGVYRVTGKTEWINALDVRVEDTSDGRFNENFVDLNRNWDCNWSANAVWRNQLVDPGSEPFSEPENRALRDYILGLGAEAVIFWHSALGIVAPGRCEERHAPSEALAEAYGVAAGYPVQPFTAYDVTGDASDWLASQGIASASVELTDHDNTEQERNLEGVLAVLALYEDEE